MTDFEYDQLVDAVLNAVEEQINDIEHVDLDYETAGGILTIIFPDKSKIIINKQPPLQQIWVATKFNGHHFEFQENQWVDNRFGGEFWQFLSEASSKQANNTLTFSG